MPYSKNVLKKRISWTVGRITKLGTLPFGFRMSNPFTTLQWNVGDSLSLKTWFVMTLAHWLRMTVLHGVMLTTVKFRVCSTKWKQLLIWITGHSCPVEKIRLESSWETVTRFSHMGCKCPIVRVWKNSTTLSRPVRTTAWLKSFRISLIWVCLRELTPKHLIPYLRKFY